MDHYKSWSGLNKWLCECLCKELKDRITYFLTRYHKVHDSYGRAAILLDDKELALFSWIVQYRQEQQVSAKYAEARSKGWFELYDEMKPAWDETCTYIRVIIPPFWGQHQKYDFGIIVSQSNPKII